VTTPVENDADTAVIHVSLDEYEILIHEYERAKQRAAEAEAEAEEVRTMLLKLLPGEDEAPNGVVATVRGVERLSYKPYGARHLSLSRLRSQYPSIAAECTEWVTRWRLTLKPGDPA
jgi:hypothetical protein